MDQTGARLSKAERKKHLEEALSKIDDFPALLSAVDAGAFADYASTIGSVFTTDYRKEHDERTAEGKQLSLIHI